MKTETQLEFWKWCQHETPTDFPGQKYRIPASEQRLIAIEREADRRANAQHILTFDDKLTTKPTIVRLTRTRGKRLIKKGVPVFPISHIHWET